MATMTLTKREADASAATQVPLTVLAGGKPKTPVILALDLGQRTGWAVRNRDGAIASGVQEFRPGRFEGGGMIWLRFRGWLKGNKPPRVSDDYPSTVWNLPTVKVGEKTEHPTSKPIEVFAIPANAAGSYLKAGTAATGSSVFSIQKNGAQFLTATVAGAGTTASFSGSQTDFAAGDVLKVVAPSSADATLADIALTLAATLL